MDSVRYRAKKKFSWFYLISELGSEKWVDVVALMDGWNWRSDALPVLCLPSIPLGVAAFHGLILQWNFATENPFVFSGLVLLQIF